MMADQKRVEAQPLLSRRGTPPTSSDEEETAEGNKGKLPRPVPEEESHDEVLETMFERPPDDDDEDLSVKALVATFKDGSIWSMIGRALFSILHALYIFLLETWVAIRYVTSDSRRNKRNFVVAVVTIVIVVTFVVALASAIDKSPLVFIKLAENTLGEFDVVLTPLGSPIKLQPKEFYEKYNSGKDNPLNFLLNCSNIQRRLEGVNEIAGASPRWTMLGRIGNRFNPERNASAIILVIDSQREKDIGLGRAWTHPPLGDHQAVASGPLLRNIGVKYDANEWATLTIDIAGLADSFGFSGNYLRDGLKTLFVMGTKALVNSRNLTFDASNASQAITEFEQVFNVTIPPFIRGLIQAQLDQFFKNLPPGVGINLNQFITDALLNRIFDAFYNPAFLRLTTEIQVAGAVEDPSGKWPSTLGSVVVLEAKYIPFIIFKDWLPAAFRDNPQVIRAILRNIPNYPSAALKPGTTIDQMLNVFPVNDYAIMVMVQKKDRLDLYMKDKEARDVETIKWTNKMMLALGMDLPLAIETPINDFLIGGDIARAFLAQLLIAMLVVLLLHSMLVIYSLLLSNTEDRTYEYGMLRALGLKHSSLIQLLTIQALYYSVPAILIGLFLGFLVYIPIAYFIAAYAATSIDVGITVSAITTGVLLGLLMPIVANIVPIRRALSQTLRDALDLYHQRFAETVVKIVKLESLGISIEQTVWSLIMIIFGFALIYVVPLAFRFQYWQLFIGILNATLLGMVMGLAMIAGVLQQRVESLMLHILLWGRLRKLKNIVKKSLNAHGDRNRKTALMFTTVVAFVIFASSAFHFQTASVTDNIKILSGSDIVFQSVTYRAPLDEEQMTTFLKQEKANPGTKLKSWSFATFPLSNDPAVVRTSISNMAGQPMPSVRIWGVDENYMETMYDEYFVKTDIDDSFNYELTANGMPNIIKSLYTDAGKAKLPIEGSTRHVPPVIGTGPVPNAYNRKSANDTSYIDPNNYPTLFTPSDQSSVPYILFREENSTYNNYLDVIASTAMHGINLYIKQPIQIQLRFRITRSDHESRMEYLAKPRAFVSKVPGFFFSWLEILARTGQPMLVSMDTFSKLNEDMYYARSNASVISGLKVPAEWLDNYSPVPRKSKLLIRMDNDATRDEREFVMNGLKNFVKSDLILVSDTTELIESARFAVSLLLLFFYVIATIAILLCFFVLWISFTANVRENSWEFGVLRAIGLSIWEVILVYIFEAMSIILTSVILATAIGLMVSLTLTLQYTLFNDMTFTFYFPTSMFLFLFTLSMIVSLLGSYLPANQLGKKQIASTIRGH